MKTLWMATLLVLAGCNGAQVRSMNPTAVQFGDSVSLGASGHIRLALNGQVDFRHDAWDAEGIEPTNTPYFFGKTVQFGNNDGCAALMLRSMRAALADKAYTVIVFNAGLHDTQTHISPQGCGNTSLADYRESLEQAASLAEMHASIVIWVNTTPIPAGFKDQVAGSQMPYNAAADAIMREHGIWIVETDATGQRPSNIHFTEAGYIHLADLISTCLIDTLAQQQPSTCHK